MVEPAGNGRQRIDKWLWFARVVKTRTLAQKLAVSGRVRINREKCGSASDAVRIGDVLTIALERSVRVLKIVSPGARRGPPPEARRLYEDLSPPAETAPQPTSGARAPGSGRPTKRDHRRLVALQSGNGDDFPAGED